MHVVRVRGLYLRCCFGDTSVAGATFLSVLPLSMRYQVYSNAPWAMPVILLTPLKLAAQLPTAVECREDAVSQRSCTVRDISFRGSIRLVLFVWTLSSLTTRFIAVVGA